MSESSVKNSYIRLTPILAPTHELVIDAKASPGRPEDGEDAWWERPWWEGIEPKPRRLSAGAPAPAEPVRLQQVTPRQNRNPIAGLCAADKDGRVRAEAVLGTFAATIIGVGLLASESDALRAIGATLVVGAGLYAVRVNDY